MLRRPDLSATRGENSRRKALKIEAGSSSRQDLQRLATPRMLMDDARAARIARPPVGLTNNCHKARHGQIFFASSLLVALQSQASLPQSAPAPLTAPNRRGMRREQRTKGVRTAVCYFRNMRITRQSSNAQPRQPSEEEAPQQQRLLQTRHAALSADKQHWHCQQSPAGHREITTPIYVHAPRVLVGSFDAAFRTAINHTRWVSVCRVQSLLGMRCSSCRAVGVAHVLAAWPRVGTYPHTHTQVNATLHSRE